MDRYVTLKPKIKRDDDVIVCDVVETIDCRRTEVALRTLVFDTPDMCKDSMFIFVYCDLVSHRYVGDSVAQLLAAAAARKALHQHIEPSLLFSPICKDYVYDSVEIMLYDEYGRDINTDHESLEITLQLRRSR